MKLNVFQYDDKFLLDNLNDIRKLLIDAYEGDFSEEDWLHTIGGVRFLATVDDVIVAHCAVITREMMINNRPITVGYLEGMAVSIHFQGKGIGSHLLAEISQFCRSSFELSMLSTDEFDFYGKFGWKKFVGVSGVNENKVQTRTPDEDENLMYLWGNSVSEQPIYTAYCDLRAGDSW